MKKNYSHLLNPNHATLIFKCNFKTVYGQTLRIVGNIEELGSWEPSKSLIMTTDETKYPIWESTQEITGPIGMEIYYKYVIYDKNTNQYIWENLNDNINRKHKINNSGIFVINDKIKDTTSIIQKLMEPSNDSDFPLDININNLSDDYNYDKDSNGNNSSIININNNSNNFSNGNMNMNVNININSFNRDLYKTLSYDSNQFNGNELNETFYFCFKVL
jgi:hypothetical protein